MSISNRQLIVLFDHVLFAYWFRRMSVLSMSPA